LRSLAARRSGTAVSIKKTRAHWLGFNPPKEEVEETSGVVSDDRWENYTESDAASQDSDENPSIERPSLINRIKIF
jgi:hypothetical protein